MYHPAKIPNVSYENSKISLDYIKEVTMWMAGIQAGVLAFHGETVLNDSVQILAYHFSRIISHSQVIKYSSYIASEFFDC